MPDPLVCELCDFEGQKGMLRLPTHLRSSDKERSSGAVIAGDGHLFPRADEEPAYTGRHGTGSKQGRQHLISAEEDDLAYRQGERGR